MTVHQMRDLFQSDSAAHAQSDPLEMRHGPIARSVPTAMASSGSLGSPDMASAQWIGAGHVDGRTDLCALGIGTYGCVTGRPPFVGNTITAIAMAHANEAPLRLGPQLPSALDRGSERAGGSLSRRARVRGCAAGGVEHRERAPGGAGHGAA